MCVPYGIPYNSKRILKYDQINDTTSFVGEEAEEHFSIAVVMAPWEETDAFIRSLQVAKY